MQVSVYGKYMHTLHEHSMSLQYVNVTVSPAGLVTSIYTQIWRPYKIKYIKLFECIQRRATKFILQDL